MTLDPSQNHPRPDDFRSDHTEAMQRAMLSLDGLSCGDGFGECFFSTSWTQSDAMLQDRVLPSAPWYITDDTLMAVSIFLMLYKSGRIVEDELAAHFASLYDPMRGYGSAMHGLLMRIQARGGRFWQEEASALFNGAGSFGNGAAMRVAPLGAYFADNLEVAIEQARRSATATHSHPEAAAGAIAVAVATAITWQSRTLPEPMPLPEFLETVRAHVPESKVRDGIGRALLLPEDTTARHAGAVLGNGSQVTAMDTVPFVLWSAGRFMAGYEEALWQTVSGRGDMDTTCAMVGGIVAMRTGRDGIPAEWLRRREPIYTFLQKR